MGDAMDELFDRLPVLGICGYSGAGKTTLVEKLIGELREEGLAVAVVKHDAHGLQVDKPGKDSDRFFQAGATVLARGPEESFLRIPVMSAPDLHTAVQYMLQSHDLVLVEGHKQTALPAKIWLEGGKGPALDNENFVLTLGREEPRLELTLRFIRTWLQRQYQRRPLRAGVLIGGKSSRMGQPKHLMEVGGRSWLESICDTLGEATDSVCILGAGELPSGCKIPRLPDVPGRQGPVAGMLAAMRWDPACDWFFAACDMPYMTPEALNWLNGQRRPGVWSIIPRNPETEKVEPLLAIYSPQARTLLEPVHSPRTLASHGRTAVPTLPLNLRKAWANINTPEELPVEQT